MCRLCGAPLRHTFVDLGMSPLCESFLAADELNRMEPFYPLHVLICAECLLVQLEAYVDAAEIFREYAYFSSYSTSWVEHARTYSEQMIDRLGLDGGSLVVELASNDGYLLQHFVARGIPSLGIDPAANVAVGNNAGVYEIKIAPSDPSRFYMMYLGSVFRSDDRGTTWASTAFTPTTDTSNDGYRTNG